MSKIHRTTNQGSRQYIAAREDFRVNGGNLSGETRSGIYAPYCGYLPKAFETIKGFEIAKATFVVYSYSTPIAWYAPGSGWIIPQVSYSPTTSTKHQSQLYGLDPCIRPDVYDAAGIDKTGLSKTQLDVMYAAVTKGWKVTKSATGKVWTIGQKGKPTIVVYWTKSGAVRLANETRAKDDFAPAGSKDKAAAVVSLLYGYPRRAA